jgi:DNA-binding response OmpR family regulator
MNDVISKPFPPHELHRKIKKALKTGQMVKA